MFPIDRLPKYMRALHQGCLGMAVGEVRKLDIPANEGYGSNGNNTSRVPIPLFASSQQRASACMLTHACTTTRQSL